MRVTKLFIFIISLIILVIIGYRYASNPKLKVVYPTRGPAVEAVYATGIVESELMIPVASQITARLSELYVDEGDFVKKGQLLAKFENREFSEIESQLKVREEYAEDQYSRNKILYESKAISIDEFKKSKTEWLAAKSATNSAQSRSEYLLIKATADGQIIKREGEVGELIPLNQAIFWISGSTNLRISAEVDEEEISKVNAGQKVLIQADAFPGQVFKGLLSKITPMGNSDTKSFRVRISLPETSSLLIGMTVENNIIIRESLEALLVPSTAVVQNYIWIIDDKGFLRKVEVRLGAKGPIKTEVVSGVSEQDKIVVSPTIDFKENDKIDYQLLE